MSNDERHEHEHHHEQRGSVGRGGGADDFVPRGATSGDGHPGYGRHLSRLQRTVKISAKIGEIGSRRFVKLCKSGTTYGYIVSYIFLWLLCIPGSEAGRSASTTHGKAEVFTITGDLALEPVNQVYTKVADGHIMFELSLQPEFDFLKNASTKLFPKYNASMNSTTAPKLLLQTLSDRLSRYDKQLKGFWAMIRQQHDRRRPTRWLPLVSLGLGVVTLPT